MLVISTAVLIGVITLLTFLCTKLLAVLVGALLLYFCPVIFLMFAGAVTLYFCFSRRGKARARRIMGTFSNRGAK